MSEPRRWTEDWRDLAACRDLGPTMFHQGIGGSYTEARRVCSRCEVRSECLAWAVEQFDPLEVSGMYGGKTPRELEAIIRSGRGVRRGVAECGTYSGYSHHMDNREEPCEPCRDAKRAYARELAARRKKFGAEWPDDARRTPPPDSGRAS